MFLKTTRIYLILLSLFAFYSILFSQDWIEVVYLKNGSIIKGVIIEQIPNVSLKIQTADGSIFVYKMEEVLKIAKEEVKPKEEPKPEIKKETMKIIPEYELKPGESIPSQRDPAVAFILSFLIVGTGQYYNGDVGKGLVQEIGVIGGYLIATTTNSTETGAFMGGLLLIISCELWSWIDAPTKASKINERREYLLKKEKMQSLRLTPIILPEREGTKIGISLRF